MIVWIAQPHFHGMYVLNASLWESGDDLFPIVQLVVTTSIVFLLGQPAAQRGSFGIDAVRRDRITRTP